MYETYPYYTKEGLNKGKDYKCKPNEVGTLDFANKRFIITTLPTKDDKIVKKTIITFKGNTKGGITHRDTHTNKLLVDNCSNDAMLFEGTDKELSVFVDRLIDEGYNIRDFYDYE